ncbi:hypothetical protein P691DRAFT_495219 [Macrolepiota fuliginosa MF-IS2]|uniref:Uncharacterized protein n=1 Tax=Macrolepiota fuliginosa MF-IS2 TaxID=1400762 RepID=A0A9P5X050_9AGAR|nr:hypothetical protein P691DRAFT_495219 [Macrolepiota fuliginosa MF-IS2]
MFNCITDMDYTTCSGIYAFPADSHTRHAPPHLYPKGAQHPHGSYGHHHWPNLYALTPATTSQHLGHLHPHHLHPHSTHDGWVSLSQRYPNNPTCPSLAIHSGTEELVLLTHTKVGTSSR